MNNRALSKSETAALIGCCEKTLDRLIASGRIKAHRIGGRWKVFEDDLNAYLASCANVQRGGVVQVA
jgi:excisionase family DNA binding protein